MTPAEAQKRILELRAQIAHHDERYYQQAQPEIDDLFYDALFRELRELESEFPELVTPESPTQRVGERLLGGFRQIEHSVPMLSLDNIYAKEDPNKPTTTGFRGLKHWIDSVQAILPGETLEWIVEPKIDGLAISLRYEGGKFKFGATRGDGAKGDDLTQNIRTIKGLPMELFGDVPEVLEVRGEVYLPIAEFQRLCEEMRNGGEEPFVNPRNAAVGSLRQLDPQVVAKRGLSVVLYGIGEVSDHEPATQRELLRWLDALSFPVPRFTRLCHDAGEVFGAISELDHVRSSFGFETDGAVIKLNNIVQRVKVGETARSPKWAKAWKFPPQQAETQLKEISIQVGRTGVLTPVAELNPVFLSGSTISRATLHNEDEIRAKDIRIGDFVVVEKAGEVIPAVVRVVIERRPHDTRVFDFSAHLGGKCPECGEPIRRDPKFAAWLCENVNCPAQKTRRLVFFAARDALDLEGLGETVADNLVEKQLVREPLDVFDLKLDELSVLNLGTVEAPRMFGEKNARRLLDAIERSRSLSLARWVYALAIPDVGEETARDIANVHDSIEAIAESELLKSIVELARLNREMLSNSPNTKENKKKAVEQRENLRPVYESFKTQADELGSKLITLGLARPASGEHPPARDAVTVIGPVAARSVVEWFRSQRGLEVLRRLKELKISPKGVSTKQVGAAFAGKTIVITGTLESMSRNEAQEKIRSLGGGVAKTVSRKTDLVVAGSDAGSKLEDAKRFGVKVIDETEFLRLSMGTGNDQLSMD